VRQFDFAFVRFAVASFEFSVVRWRQPPQVWTGSCRPCRAAEFRRRGRVRRHV